MKKEVYVLGDYYSAGLNLPRHYFNDEVKSVVAQYYGKESISDIDDWSISITGDSHVVSINDDQAPNGQFPDIERYLVEKQIPFDRWEECTGACNPAYRRIFRPGLVDQMVPETDLGAVIETEVLWKLTELDDPAELAKRLRELLHERDPAHWVPSLESYNEGGDKA